MVEKVEESIFKEVVKIPLLGYSNGNKDYQKAKTPIISGWQKEDFRGMNETEEEYHTARGGWVGLRIPEGYILVDIDDEAVGELVFWALREEGIKSHVMKTPRGWQFFFKDNGKVASQTSKVMAKSGVVVDYRLAGRGYTVLP
ncbi:MAG: bifunctional DNA primase/polymerase, partial [Acutalibacteraceae bacterium]